VNWSIVASVLALAVVLAAATTGQAQTTWRHIPYPAHPEGSILTREHNPRRGHMKPCADSARAGVPSARGYPSDVPTRGRGDARPVRPGLGAWRTIGRWIVVVSERQSAWHSWRSAFRRLEVRASGAEEVRADSRPGRALASLAGVLMLLLGYVIWWAITG
jgi:hypothetical protein